MKTLSINELIVLHDKIIKKTGGSSGIRDIGLLESALNKAFQTFDGEDLYPDILDKISTFVYSTINNHPMIDGNKRLGVMVLWMLLNMNKINIEYSQKEFIELGLGIADGQVNENDITLWIQKHSI